MRHAEWEEPECGDLSIAKGDPIRPVSGAGKREAHMIVFPVAERTDVVGAGGIAEHEEAACGAGVAGRSECGHEVR